MPPIPDFDHTFINKLEGQTKLNFTKDDVESSIIEQADDLTKPVHPGDVENTKKSEGIDSGNSKQMSSGHTPPFNVEITQPTVKQE